MSGFLIDTNICIYAMRGRNPAIGERFVENDGSLAISSIVLGELMFGIEKSDRRDQSRKALDAFLSNIEVVAFDGLAAEHYGAIRAHLERAGTPCGHADILIGAHARSLDLTLVTKIGARRGSDASWLPAFSAQELTQAVHDNLRNLQLDVLDVVNLRIMFSAHGPAEGSIAEPLATLAELQQQGLVRHIGLSNVTATQVAEAQKMVQVVCVQNMYNIVNRGDDALVDSLAQQGIAYVPFFPLGGFTPLQSSGLQAVADSLGVTAMQVALAWLLQRSPNILLIPGTSSVAHLRQNLAAAELVLPADALETLDSLAD